MQKTITQELRIFKSINQTLTDRKWRRTFYLSKSPYPIGNGLWCCKSFIDLENTTTYFWFDTALEGGHDTEIKWMVFFFNHISDFIPFFIYWLSSFSLSPMIFNDFATQHDFIFLTDYYRAIISYFSSFPIILMLFTNPSARAGYDTRSIFKWSLTGLNSEFSFS